MKKERIKDKLEVSALIGIFLLSVLAITPTANADEIKFGFKNPSFSGVGTGAHYLTIENQEFSRKKAIEDALEAARKAAEREADNTTLAKFIRNLESRIYAQMAKQLVESMFSNDNPVRFGSFVLEGSTTVIEIPIGTGYFGDDGSGDGDGGS